ncbi:hypothetical protein FH609_005640 [Streptomyces sp. 3MP-14]|uniref:Zinc finger CGNR domain-containing protein n=1 Tax=Streptomyces mimosae TaxID=2586635 RepID=A0A5N6AM69_9ACTN|nr:MULTISPECIES: ABATE domain-containing protein [Streptomyces]KAB8169771.1 hypothetical protein FH607_003320 [Streptomyces mimosae]KAB8178519.1 hypothetical protein FH609_005640 [Streptomyces sp. 3MP-14]
MIHAFPCGAPALDFVGTLRARRNDEPTEKLTTPADLDTWFVESDLLPAGAAPDERDLAAAIELREAIYALVWARLHERALPPDAIATVNATAAEPPPRPVLTAAGWSRAGSARQALSHLAREAIEIVGGERARLLRECGRPECTQVYLDHSRGRRREWCSMATCGSRVKAKAYRERRKSRATA